MMEPELTVTANVSFRFAGLAIEGKTFTMTVPLSALANAQAADTALKTEISAYIADVATALKNALTSGNSTAIQQIADDMTSQAAQLVAADPLTPPAGTSPPLPGT
jgi:hypothetical protein